MNAGLGGNHFFLKLASSAVRGLEFVRVKRRMDRTGHCRKKFWFFSSISHKHLTILATHMGLYASWSGSFSPGSVRNWVGWEGQFLLSSNFLLEPTLLSLEPGTITLKQFNLSTFRFSQEFTGSSTGLPGSDVKQIVRNN